MRELWYFGRHECNVSSDLGLSQRVPATVVQTHYRDLIQTYTQCLSLYVVAHLMLVSDFTFSLEESDCEWRH